MDSQSLAQIPGLSGSYGVDLRSQPPPGEMGGVLAELIAEKESLDPAYVHCARLLEAGTLKDPGVGIVALTASVDDPASDLASNEKCLSL